MSSLAAFPRKKLSTVPAQSTKQQLLQPLQQQKQKLSDSPITTTPLSSSSSSFKDSLEIKVKNPNIRKSETSLSSPHAKIPRRSDRQKAIKAETISDDNDEDDAENNTSSSSSSSTKTLKHLTDNFCEMPSTISISSSILSGSWDECSNAEKILRKWDLEVAYGPASGESRRKRWERAAKLGKNPPYYVIELLEEGESDKPLWKKYNL